MKKLFTIKGIIAAVAVMFALSLTSCKKDGNEGKDDEVVKVTGIKFTKSEITIAVNKTTTLEYTITPSNATNKGVTFTSDKESVAKVEANGEVKGISEGTAKITVTTKDGGFKATCNVTVDKGGSGEGGENGGDQKILVETITIEPSTKELNVEETFQLDVTVFPANATDKTLTWSSSSDNVTVDSLGKITAVKEGNATITATAKDSSGTKATCEVTVQTKVINVETITITPSTKELSVGDSFQLDATVLPANATDKTLTWTSSSDNVTVDSSGKIIAVKEGNATITATAKDSSGIKATCEVTVQTKVINVETITITPSTKELSVGDSFQLEATVLPANATNQTLAWESSSDNVTVDSSGKITAVKEGNATITATAKDGSGVKATCTVNCKEENLDYKSEYTQADYYMWDAYKPYENIPTGTWGPSSAWYNETTELASASCKDCPTAEQMVAYLKAGVYWDDNTTVAEGKKTYTLNGETTKSYSTGLWVKKKRYIDNFDFQTDKTYSTIPKRLSTLTDEKVKNIRTSGEYFFLPACDRYDSGSFYYAGTKGFYWSSTPYAASTSSAYSLSFYSDNASVNYFGGFGFRYLGYVPMPLL